VSYVGFSLVAALLLILDVGLGGLLSLGPIRPSLTMPFVVYIGLKRGPIPGTLFGAALGLGLDILGAMPLGATSFSYCIVGFACGKLWKSENPFRLLWPWAAFLLLGGLFEEAVSHYLVARGDSLPFGPLYVSSGLPTALYTAALGILWFLSPLHRVRSS
jgi:rod shape-determining protein MreD